MASCQIGDESNPSASARGRRSVVKTGDLEEDHLESGVIAASDAMNPRARLQESGAGGAAESVRSAPCSSELRSGEGYERTRNESA